MRKASSRTTAITDVFLYDVTRFRRAHRRVDDRYDLLDVVHQHDAPAPALVTRLDDPNVQRAIEAVLRPQDLHLLERSPRRVYVGFERRECVIDHLELCVFVSQQIVLCEEDVPVVLPDLDITFHIDVVVQAAVDEVLAATHGELHAIHRNPPVFRDQRERALFFESLQQPSE